MISFNKPSEVPDAVLQVWAQDLGGEIGEAGAGLLTLKKL